MQAKSDSRFSARTLAKPCSIPTVYIRWLKTTSHDNEASANAISIEIGRLMAFGQFQKITGRNWHAPLFIQVQFFHSVIISNSSESSKHTSGNNDPAISMDNLPVNFILPINSSCRFSQIFP